MSNPSPLYNYINGEFLPTNISIATKINSKISGKNPTIPIHYSEVYKALIIPSSSLAIVGLRTRKTPILQTSQTPKI